MRPRKARGGTGHVALWLTLRPAAPTSRAPNMPILFWPDPLLQFRQFQPSRHADGAFHDWGVHGPRLPGSCTRRAGGRSQRTGGRTPDRPAGEAPPPSSQPRPTSHVAQPSAAATMRKAMHACMMLLPCIMHACYCYRLSAAACLRLSGNLPQAMTVEQGVLLRQLWLLLQSPPLPCRPASSALRPSSRRTHGALRPTTSAAG